MTKEKFIYGLNACAVTYHNGQKFYEHDDLVKCFEDLGLLEQEPFMNKPCVAHQVCHEDKVKVLDKIRADIIDLAEGWNGMQAKNVPLGAVLKVIDKHTSGK